MSVTISKESNNCIVITIKGILLYDDFVAAENAGKGLFKAGDRINCLLLATEFTGWGKEGDWGDLTNFYKNDQVIANIAVVAKEEKRDELLMFLGAGRRKAEVEFFFPDEEEDAREWLNSAVNE